LSVLFKAGASLVAVFTDEDFGFIEAADAGSEAKNCEWRDIKGPVDVVLVHEGDSAAWKKQVGAKWVFRFNTPGFSGGRPSDLRICRATGASNFEVTVDDAREILQFGKGIRSEPPSCCSPKFVLSYLPALAILCQGYLATYAVENGCEVDDEVLKALGRMGWRHREHCELVTTPACEDVCDAAWWLSALDLAVGSLGAVQDAKWEAFCSSMSREWGSSTISDALGPILAKLRTGEPVKSALDVARAYLAISDRLRDNR
jgi:hypothetical protein